MKKLFAVCIVLASIFVSFEVPSSAGKPDKLRRAVSPIANRYIVVLDEQFSGFTSGEVESAAKDLTENYSGRVVKVFSSATHGYAVEMSEQAAMQLSEDPRVKFVEEDGIISVDAEQLNATWGIDRIDQRPMPLSTTYQYDRTGAGVTAYVIDTGIFPTHLDFGGRAQVAFDVVGDGQNGVDCNGHGTHVAGTIGGTTSGVAKQVKLRGVRVLGCGGSGSVSDVIAGIDWVTANAVRPAVVNMSLGGDPSDALDAAVAGSVASGLPYVLAAGNSNLDACNYSPGRVPSAITVAASDQSDARAFFSNFGSCVDIFAPGMWVVSAWITTDNTYASLNGTSMASPHVAGVAALLLEQDPSLPPSQLATLITGASTTGVLTSIGVGSPDRLLYSRIETAPVPCNGTRLSGSVTGGTPGFQSSSNGFAASTGMFRGELRPSGASAFRLSLEQRKGHNWPQIAQSSLVNGVQTIAYRGKSGTYRWRIDSLDGGGSYFLCSVTP